MDLENISFAYYTQQPISYQYIYYFFVEMMEIGGYIEPIENDDTQGYDSSESLPRSITIPLQIGYERKFFEYFDRSHFKAEAFIKEVAALSMDYFIQVQKKRDFPTITWKIDREIVRYINVNINSDERCEQVGEYNTDGKNKIKKLRKEKNQPLIIFSEDLIYQDESPHGGCAPRSSICNPKSIKYGKTWGVVDLTFLKDTMEERKERLARTMAHELGHMVSFVFTIYRGSVILGLFVLL